ncbi:hypothetical protein DK1_000028 [Bacillus phage DK1]|uniref:Uncharacterized protein n=1 Tax=Bacillus phage DK1 TaxID=2500808 RepID=A0A3T0IIT0_9CAUD|nr:hypothetical protein H3016_gp28 [Bacillus phage DK1]AZU99732.1 hypothetical protein DK1_000028 [Bacillus phage DK1]
MRIASVNHLNDINKHERIEFVDLVDLITILDDRKLTLHYLESVDENYIIIVKDI